MAKNLKNDSSQNMKNFQKEIEKLAHEMYMERVKKNISGDPQSDWLKAENQVKAKYNK